LFGQHSRNPGEDISNAFNNVLWISYLICLPIPDLFLLKMFLLITRSWTKEHNITRMLLWFLHRHKIISFDRRSVVCRQHSVFEL